jgi:spore maturation protein CgeB
MKLLFWQWNSFCGRGIEKALEKLGVDHDSVYFHPASFEEDEKHRDFLDKALSKGYDALLSVNFSTEAARMCEKHGCLYFSWIYDCPVNIVDREPMKSEFCRLFFFDSMQAERASSMGMKAFYLPLAADPSVFAAAASKGKSGKYDVSFVGNLYKSEYENYLKPLDDYSRGYLEGIVRSQSNLPYGYLIPEVVTEELTEKLNAFYRAAGGSGAEISRRQLIYLLACETTGRARVTALKLLSGRFKTALWSSGKDERLSSVEVNPYTDYYDGMPAVFASSKINLNISLKAIEAGIPLRVLDIISCGGFVLTDWKMDMEEFFIPGESIETYSSLEELYAKTDFYVRNESARAAVIGNARAVLDRAFRFEDRLGTILGTA